MWSAVNSGYETKKQYRKNCNWESAFLTTEQTKTRELNDCFVYADFFSEICPDIQNNNYSNNNVN